MLYTHPLITVKQLNAEIKSATELRALVNIMKALNKEQSQETIKGRTLATIGRYRARVKRPLIFSSLNDVVGPM